MDFKDKNIAILGFGVEGREVFEFLAGKGAKITICDRKTAGELTDLPENIDTVLGENYLANLDRFDIIFRSPGMPILHPEIVRAKEKGTIITSATKLFFELSPAKIIGVTGTKGKGTTTSLISEILKRKSQNPNDKLQINSKFQIPKSKIFLGGNIGETLLLKLPDMTAKDWVVYELSSFQLQDMDVSPHIGVVLNITEDHLDYHQNRQEYVEAKKNIIANQKKSDFAVINADYLTSYEFSSYARGEIYYFSKKNWVDRGGYIAGKGSERKVAYNTGTEEIELCDISELKLRGEHNLENICAAVTAGVLAGASFENIAEAVINFTGLEHRLELVGEKKGIKYYNDSFATGPQPTIAAIKSFTEPIILILGGRDKNLDFSELAQLINESANIKAVILIGELTEKLTQLITEKDQGTKVIKGGNSMAEIVAAARNVAETGDVVLLSPSAASFDMFASYKERGQLFKEAVKKLEG